MKKAYRDNEAFIEIKDLTFSYKKSSVILNNVSISFYKSEITAIIGPNGSGKTTLGKLMSGILSSEQGSVFLEGTNIKGITLGNIGKKVGYLFQQPERQLFNPTVKEEIGFAHLFMGEPKDKVDKKVSKIIEELSLQGLENSSPYKISRGERQRVALATILINEPSFLILDEPTTGLDMIKKDKLSEILKNLQQQNIGMVIISHDKSFIKSNADRTLEVSGGEINEV